MNCPNCGAAVAEGTSFCGECGTKIDLNTTAAPLADARQGAVSTSVNPVPFVIPQGATYRIKCASCGFVGDYVNDGTHVYKCGKCGAPHTFAGQMLLSRMGSPYGVAAGFGVYIDGAPFGHIANKQTVRILLPEGLHNIHVSCGMNRKCNDYTFTIDDKYNTFSTKVYMKPGFWTNTLVLAPCPMSEIPQA